MSSVCSVPIHWAGGKLISRIRLTLFVPVEKEIEMVSYLQKMAIVLLATLTIPAWAGQNERRYAVTSSYGSQYDYARVIDAQPVIEVVRIPGQGQVCRDQTVQRRVSEYRSPAPVILGAVIGGVIGNQLSRGHGHRHDHWRGHRRAAATFAGAAIGGVVASEIQYSRYPARYYTENVRVCGPETHWRHEERVVAWDVSWKYRGRVYHSRMTEPPGDRIRVRVNVDPVYP